jgi:hypothetical protein
MHPHPRKEWNKMKIYFVNNFSTGLIDISWNIIALLFDRANNKLARFLFITYVVYRNLSSSATPLLVPENRIHVHKNRWKMRYIRRLIFTLLGAALWDVCIQKVWHTRSFQLFVQVIDRHLCTELMCSVCNSICSLLKVININDNTLGSSILTHTHTHCAALSVRFLYKYEPKFILYQYIYIFLFCFFTFCCRTRRNAK